MIGNVSQKNVEVTYVGTPENDELGCAGIAASLDSTVLWDLKTK